MKNRSIRKLSCFFAICGAAAIAHSANAFAAKKLLQQSDLGGSAVSENSIEDRPFRLYGGAAFGYGNVSGRDYSNALDGPQYLLNADLSYQTPSWVYDLGAGWLYSKLQGAVNNGAPADMRIRAGFMDASVRYRFGRHWQVGPAYNLLFGADSDFNPTAGDKNVTSLLGARLVYEFETSHFPVRILGQALTSLGVNGNHYVQAIAGFQIGLPFCSKHSSSTDVASNDVIRVTSAATLHVPSDEVRVTLDPEKIFFTTDSAQIRPEVRGVLQDLGVFLSRNNDAWGHLRLGGHADQRGSAKYNLKLSRRRANSVLNALALSGLDASKISAEAFGFYHPADPGNNRVAWAKNRRVELIFAEVKNPKALRSKVMKLARFQFDPNH
jgi:outer membrane protein OmpA-like peptidoglycan-associated protein